MGFGEVLFSKSIFPANRRHHMFSIEFGELHGKDLALQILIRFHNDL